MVSEKTEEAETDRNLSRVTPIQRKDGSWYAEAIWPYAPASHVGSFKTEGEVQDWIVQSSGDYFRKCGRQ